MAVLRLAVGGVRAGHSLRGGGAAARRHHPQGAQPTHHPAILASEIPAVELRLLESASDAAATPESDSDGGLVGCGAGYWRAAEECGRPDHRHPDRRRGCAVHGSLDGMVTVHWTVARRLRVQSEARGVGCGRGSTRQTWPMFRRLDGGGLVGRSLARRGLCVR